jgi:hypothetical protein
MAKSTFANDWGKVYNKSIISFTGRNKVAVRELEPVVKGTAALVSCLVRLDNGDPSEIDRFSKPKERAKSLAAYLKEIKGKFKPEVSKYRKLLEDAIAKTDKDLWPQPHKDLKAMLAQLNWVESAVESHAANMAKETIAATENIRKQIAEKEDALRKEGKTDQEVNAATNFLKQFKQLATFPAVSKTVTAKAAAALKIIKADPTGDVYNVNMEKGGRNYTQQVINLMKLYDEPDCPPDLKRILTGLSAYRAPLSEYGGGDKRSIDKAASKPFILGLLREYSDLVKVTLPYVENVARWVTAQLKKKGK